MVLKRMDEIMECVRLDVEWFWEGGCEGGSDEGKW